VTCLVKNLGELLEIEPIMKVILEEMQVRGIKSVLDVGCGPCRITKYFEGFDYTGIDKIDYATNGKEFPWAKFVWGKPVQEYVPEQPFDAVWTHCFFCLATIGDNEMRVIIEWLRKWTRWIFLCDTPRLDGVEWQKILAEAGFELEAHGVVKDATPVVEVWRNTEARK